MRRRCQPIIWCFIQCAEWDKLQKPAQSYMEQYKIRVQAVCYEHLRDIKTAVKKTLRSSSFSKHSDTIAIFYPSQDEVRASLVAQPFIMTFSDYLELGNWLNLKYESTLQKGDSL